MKNFFEISGRMLSNELQELEFNGIINRTLASIKPLAACYSMIKYGMSLKVLTDTIADWGIRHREKFKKNLERIILNRSCAQNLLMNG